MKKNKNFTIVPNYVISMSNLTPIEFRIYVTLRRFNPCFPSYSTLQKYTGLSRWSVSRGLKGLVYAGLILYEKGDSRGKNNKYVFSTSHTSEPVKKPTSHTGRLVTSHTSELQ